MVNLSNSLTGLSLLTGNFGLGSLSSDSLGIESRAVRIAKAAFTAKATTPPWKEKPSTAPDSVQLSMIKAMRSIVDKPKTGPDALPDDIQTSFIAFKAIDRLRLLAEAASKK